MLKPLLSLLAFIPFIYANSCSALTFQELKPGVDYEVIEPSQPTENPAKVEVKEFFSYGCSHCYQFEPFLNGWLKHKPESVDFIRQPVVFGRPQWAIYARIYFTAEALGVVDKIQSDVYKSIYTEEKPLQSDEEIAKFFAQHGVSESDFSKTFKSFSVDLKVKQADAVINNYKKVTGTPTLVVNGKYVVRGDYDKIFNVVDAIIKGAPK